MALCPERGPAFAESTAYPAGMNATAFPPGATKSTAPPAAWTGCRPSRLSGNTQDEAADAECSTSDSWAPTAVE